MKINKRNCVVRIAVLMFLLAIFPIELIADTLVDAAWEESIDKAMQLIEEGYDANAKDQDGFTALIASAQLGNLEMVKYLVSKGANINATNQYNANALHKVLDAEQPGTKKLSNDRIQIAHYLINNGINVNAKGYNDTTALHVALFRGDISIIELLMNNGADITAKTKKGRTPSYIANELKNKRVLEALSGSSYSSVESHLTSNSSADSEKTDPDEKKDKNKEDMELATIMAIFGIIAILARSTTAIPGLALVFGVVVTTISVGQMFSLGHITLAISFALITMSILAFPLWYPILDKNLSGKKGST